MRKSLSKDDIEIRPAGDGESILASLYEGRGYRCRDRFELSDLPNDLIGRDDLERFGIVV
jgi:hypothetical protein